jgi:hypothetical protein
MPKLYEHKDLNLGMVVLCPDCNTGLLKTTLSSIKYSYPDAPVLCVVQPADLQELQKINTKFVTGGKTITSLINAGMHNAPSDWNLIVIAGTWVRPLMDRRYSYFVESEKDILFPVVDKKMNFVDGTINGILIHKKTFAEVGDFSDDQMELSKLYWGSNAIEHGCRFKAIVGTKLG